MGFGGAGYSGDVILEGFCECSMELVLDLLHCCCLWVGVENVYSGWCYILFEWGDVCVVPDLDNPRSYAYSWLCWKVVFMMPQNSNPVIAIVVLQVFGNVISPGPTLSAMILACPVWQTHWYFNDCLAQTPFNTLMKNKHADIALNFRSESRKWGNILSFQGGRIYPKKNQAWGNFAQTLA